MAEEPTDLAPEPPEDVTEMMTPPTSGGPILPPSAAPLRETIGDFEVEAKLGAGGMGAVYRARQISLGRMVALKVLPAHMIEDAESVSRFQREARVAASLSHANLVRVFSAGAADGVHYIAMELIEGEDLGRRLKREGRLPAPEALRICAEVARGLEHAWRTAHLIHRDIKPANIFLAAGGAVKVGDLGLAKSVLGNTTGLTQSGTMISTPHYISPEQARADKEIDFRADIYSLGCTLYQMLTGQVPYAGTDPITIIRQHLDAPLPAILKVWPQCPVPLARLVGKMLKKSRHERHASYAELIAQIESVWAQLDPLSFNPEAFAPPAKPAPEATLLDTPPTPRATATLLPSAPPPKSKAPLYAGIAAGLFILAGAAFVFWPKEEKLTKAELYARQKAAEKATATPAPEPVPVKPIVATTAQPAVIKLWDSPETVPSKPGVSWDNQAVLLNEGSLYTSSAMRNVGLRAAIQIRPDAVNPQLQVRVSFPTSGKGPGPCYVLGLSSDAAYLSLSFYRDGERIQLAKWPTPAARDSNEWLPVELRAVDDQISVFAKGQLLGSIRDSSVPTAGRLSVFAKANGYFRDIEYVPLDGAVSPPPAAEPWQDVLSNRGAKISGLTRNDQGAALQGSIQLPIPSPDLAVRMRAVYSSQSPIYIRARSKGNHGYQWVLYPGATPSLHLQRQDGAEGFTTFKKLPPEPAARSGDVVELELRLVGNVLSGKWQGVEVARFEDATWTEAGELLIQSGQREPLQILSLETLSLGAPAASPSAATLSGAVAARWEPIGSEAEWRNLLLPAGDLRLVVGAIIEKGELVLPTRSNARTDVAKDGAIRATSTYAANRNAISLSARDALGIRYGMTLKGASAVRLFRTIAATGGETVELGAYPLPEPLKDGDSYELELRVIGTRVSAWTRGRLLGELEDSHITAGQFGVYNFDPQPARISRLEFLDLNTPAGGRWEPMSSEAEWRRPMKGREFKDGLLHIQLSGVSKKVDAADVALRAVVRIREDTATPSLLVRFVAGKTAYVLVLAGARDLLILRAGIPGSSYRDLAKYPLPKPLQAGERVAFELRAVGNRITGLLDGKVVVEAQDEQEPEAGEVAIQGGDVWCESAEYQILSRTEASAPSTPAAATKDAPFVNSLGMKFVPVPITGGPTDGKRVLFSIWETRVQDYEACLKETGLPWPNKPSGIEADCGAGNVTIDAARAFCAWLTAKERKDGRISSGHQYRLSSDHEWSCAAQIGQREDPTQSPVEKAGRLGDVFPWGSTWPPPPNAGNFSGEEALARAAALGRNQQAIPGYRDPFAGSSPAGSFPANAFGLFDLSGSLWEICDTPWTRGGDTASLRGGSCNDWENARFGLSFRMEKPRNFQADNAGFRVVLAPVP